MLVFFSLLFKSICINNAPATLPKTFITDANSKYIKVHTATRWTIRHGLMLLWFTDLMNVTEEVTIYRPSVSILLSSAFIRGDLNAVHVFPLQKGKFNFIGAHMPN